jgi:hypothetical protein
MIEVGAILKTETAYDKDITFIRDGVEYRVILHWDSHDGYEATWLDSEARFMTSPEWEDNDHRLYEALDYAKPHTNVEIRKESDE